MNAFPLRLGKRDNVLNAFHFFWHCTENPSHCNKARKISIQIGKEEVKRTRWPNVFLENPKESLKQLQELIGEFIKNSKYMLNI